MYRLEVATRLRVGVLSAEDPVSVRRHVRLRLDQVDRRQFEPLCELEDRLVVGIDQLAAQLRLLPARPEAGTELLPIGVHPPTPTARRLIHIGADSLVLQGQRRGQPGDAAADDGDPRRGRRPRRAGQRRRPRHGRGRPHRAGTLEELPPGHPRHLLALAQPLNLDPQLRRGAVFPRQALQSPHQRRTCHRSSARPGSGDDLASRPATSREPRGTRSCRSCSTELAGGIDRILQLMRDAVLAIGVVTGGVIRRLSSSP